MNKFIVLAVMTFSLICQDFPQKEFADASFRLAAKYKKAVVEEGQKFVTATIIYSKKCQNVK